MAELHKFRAAAHGGLFLALLMLFNAAFALAWPWYLVIPILAYGIVAGTVGPLWRTAPVFAVGRIDARTLIAAFVLVSVSMSVLVGFELLARPDLRALAARIPVEWFGNLLMTGVCFSVVNAAAEELIFRGILWDVIADEWNEWTALAVTSLLFGIGHLDGYPPGPI